MSKLRVEVITKPKKVFNSKPFTYGLRMTNIDTNIFEGGKVFSIRFNLIGLKGFTYAASKREMLIRKLDPKESCDIWIEKSKVNTAGEYWLDCSLKSDAGAVISAFQYDEFLKSDNNEKANIWGGPFFVNDYLLESQLKTNRWLLFISIIMLLATSFSAYCAYSYLGIKNQLTYNQKSQVTKK